MRKLLSGLGMLALVFAATSIAVAQAPPAQPAPQKEHEWLHQFVGEWETEGEGTAGPGQPPVKYTGTMSARMLGGFWMVSESNNNIVGVEMHAIQTLGYDAEKKQYVGTWVDSMMNHMWQYQGSVDSTGKILTLEAEGPNFSQPGKTAKYRDVYEFKSADLIVTTSGVLGEDGKWVDFMTGQAKRKK